MDSVNFISQDVQVTSVIFRQNGDQVRFENFPRQLTYKGHRYVLAEV
jgi:hypothetical protein